MSRLQGARKVNKPVVFSLFVFSRLISDQVQFVCDCYLSNIDDKLQSALHFHASFSYFDLVSRLQGARKVNMPVVFSLFVFSRLISDQVQFVCDCYLSNIDDKLQSALHFHASFSYFDLVSKL